MHPVLEKFEFKSFDGHIKIKGTERSVAFMSADGDEPSVLAIRGLAFDEAMKILQQLQSAVVKETEATPAAATAPAKVSNGEVKQTKPAAPPADPIDDEISTPRSNWHGVDIEALAKVEKLRPVVEAVIAAGHKTPEAVLKVAKDIKPHVPVLVELDKRGDFDKRIDRAATIVLEGQAS